MATKEQLTQLSSDVEEIKTTMGLLSNGLSTMEATVADLKNQLAASIASDPALADTIKSLEDTIATGKTAIATLPAPETVVVPTGDAHATEAAPSDTSANPTGAQG